MQAQLSSKDFDWTNELHKTVVQSLTTSFGLDFLLFEDKKGGDVDTIHNVRSGIYATEEVKNSYQQRGSYDSTAYHSDEKYINRGEIDKQLHKNGDLYDAYQGKKLKISEKRQLDHTISAKEIHDDPGRILARLDGVKLANQGDNLNSVHWYVNNAKKAHSMEKFLNEVVPKRIADKKNSIQKNQEKLKTMSENTPKQRQEKQEIKDKIKKEQEHIQALESIDKEEALKADRKARSNYNEQINKAYYSSSRFLKSTGIAAASMGLKMGLRQGLGLILAEIWFELREQIPIIYNKVKEKFSFEAFFAELKTTIENIWFRIKNRFHDLLTSFKDGVIGGIFSSISTTLINIFLTSTKLIGRLIRESWQTLIKAAKLIFFNPEQLAWHDLLKEVVRLLGAAAATFAGVLVNQHLITLFSFPFGDILAVFLSAMTTGVLTMGLTYFLDHSPLMQKIWNFLADLKNKYVHVLEQYQKANAELDYYLVNLSRIELNMDSDELQIFANSLMLADNEIQRSVILQAEIEKRGIDLPYEVGNADSTRNWLATLQ